jgi:hypothetical protein
MRMDEESGYGVFDEGGRDPRLHDPPKPVVLLGDRSDLASKIAKLSEDLSAPDDALPDSAAIPAPPPPGLITSASLDEARAYVGNLYPAEHEEPITLEMQRVRIADEVNAATWVTERIDRNPGQALQGDGGDSVGLRSLSNPGVEIRKNGDQIAEEEGRWSRRRARAKAVVASVLGVGLAAVCLGTMLLVRQARGESAPLTARAAIRAPDALLHSNDVPPSAALNELKQAREASSIALPNPNPLSAVEPVAPSAAAQKGTGGFYAPAHQPGPGTGVKRLPKGGGEQQQPSVKQEDSLPEELER